MLSVNIFVSSYWEIYKCRPFNFGLLNIQMMTHLVGSNGSVLILRLDTRCCRLAVGDCTIFQPGGKTGFQALFTKVANVQSYHFHFLFWSFLCFSFYNVCSVLDQNSIELKAIMLINSNVNQAFELR